MLISLDVLYFGEDTGGLIFSNNTKAIGHQWYWRYETNSLHDVNRKSKYDSYMLKDRELRGGDLRSSEVDRPLVINLNNDSSLRLMVTSGDVIHSWALPEFGVKVDAIPGRLKQAIIHPFNVGKFYGYCMELCGVKHSFMPIVVEVIYNK